MESVDLIQKQMLREIVGRIIRATEALFDQESDLALQILEDLAFELEAQAK
jgi:hypothetical protein